MAIYTRTGDDGTTALFGGRRVPKCDELVDVYGSIDEVNSLIGALLNAVTDPKLQTQLKLYQADLFTIGSTLAGWKSDLAFLDGRIKDMEKQIDGYEKELAPLNNFILPGGTIAAAIAHVVRSVTRRTERQAVALAKNQSVPPEIIRYLNRLSDWFFVLARHLNRQQGIAETVWSGQKGK